MSNRMWIYLLAVVALFGNCLVLLGDSTDRLLRSSAARSSFLATSPASGGAQ
ncbi:hypothetical protein FHS85_005321 [Rhodoligotrophos appendicifer]